MAIVGELTDLNVSGLLGLIKLHGMTGQLALQCADDDAVLHFQQGRLVRVNSSRVSQSLGDLLVHLGKLTTPQLAEALLEQATSEASSSLGALLVEQGMIAPTDLTEALAYQAEEILYRVLAWSEGTFAFTPLTLPVAAVPLPEINIEQLMLEAMLHADEWAASDASRPSLTDHVALCRPQAPSPTAPLSLKEAFIILSDIRGASCLRHVAEETRLPDYELLRLMDQLAKRGIVTITPAAATALAAD
jgi:hypothetical protein